MISIPGGITVIWQQSQLVAVPSFKIDREAVTYRQYLHYLLQTNQTINERNWQVKGVFSKTIKPRYGELDDSVKDVTWDEANQYAMWRRARLPRCIEWIRAMKGPRPDGWPDGGEAEITRYFEEFARTALKEVADVFKRHAGGLDTGEHLNPVVTFAQQWEWAIEPLVALRHIDDDRYQRAMLQAQVQRAHDDGHPEDIPRIHAHWERMRAEPPLLKPIDWEASDERPLLGFTPDQGHHENGMISSLSRTLSGGKIGFRCVEA